MVPVRCVQRVRFHRPNSRKVSVMSLVMQSSEGPTSSSQGAPKEVPLSICAFSAALTSSSAAPTMAGPQLPM